LPRRLIAIDIRPVAIVRRFAQRRRSHHVGPANDLAGSSARPQLTGSTPTLLTAATLQRTVRFLSRTVAYGHEAGDPRLDLRRHAQRRLATAPHARRGRS